VASPKSRHRLSYSSTKLFHQSVAMADNSGEELVKKAEARLKKWSLFGGNKEEEALELYSKAAAQFKLTKQWKEAGDTYLKMAELSEKTKNETDAIGHYGSAAKAYQNVDSKEAIKVFRLCVKLHMAADRFTTAARDWKEIAKMEEKEDRNKEAAEAWEQAARCHEAENGKAAAIQCWVAVARISATMADYRRAIELYEKAATQSLETDLGRWSAAEYLYKAALCRFVLESKTGECKETAEALEKYVDMHPAFENAREYKFLKSIVDAFAKDDVDKFTDVVFKFDSVLKLDPWTSKLLLKIKEVLKEGVSADDIATANSDKKAGETGGEGSTGKHAGDSLSDDPLDKLT